MWKKNWAWKLKAIIWISTLIILWLITIRSPQNKRSENYTCCLFLFENAEKTRVFAMKGFGKTNDTTKYSIHGNGTLDILSLALSTKMLSQNHTTTCTNSCATKELLFSSGVCLSLSFSFEWLARMVYNGLWMNCSNVPMEYSYVCS